MYAPFAFLRSRAARTPRASATSVFENGRSAVLSDPVMEGMTSAAHRRRLDSQAFFRVRVSILLSILIAVLIWAGCDIQRRRARNHWIETLDVALILVRNDNL